MVTVLWGREVAETYDAMNASLFDPQLLDRTVDVLAAVAGTGQALELALGTGRVALPLSARGVAVQGVDLSPHMVDQLRRKPHASAVPVTLEDMASARVPGEFTLVYLLFNTIMNLTSQDEQVAVFTNAARHLLPGGAFVVEVVVPQLPALPPGQLGRVFALEPDHVGLETCDDVESQVTCSHHWALVDGRLVRHSAPYRYVWPAEMDLMARIAGLRLQHRWADWTRAPFTSSSTAQVAVYTKG